MDGIESIKRTAERIAANIGKVIVGREETTRLALICLISSSHMLLEDVPGTGKTLFARALAKSIGCAFSRVQFTPDLLPSDITGIHYYNQKENEFVLRHGPVFTNILLADEINRATPRTQSALLECMEERQVTIDRHTLPLNPPYFVIATQNPVETQGTFPLPEAQLDRFLVKCAMGYPSKEEALLILDRFDGFDPMAELTAAADARDVTEAARLYPAVYISDELKRYIIDIAEATRNHKACYIGVSPRGTQALMKAAKINAAIEGRSFTTPDDIKAMAIPVLRHRVVTGLAADGDNRAAELIHEILSKLPVPKDRA